MRLIDANALMEYCNNLKGKTIDANDIARFPTAVGWISVKDRLPKSMVNKVLVWLEHKDFVGYIGFGHYEKYKGQEIWFDLEHSEAFSIRGYAVTHWMPLPEPPEEK